ncbi:UDP-N-acetylmuramoylalanine-D-glutamate ligase [Thiobacillus denitrificans ATCC 25259]|uniref:UDP-N-acetylmuramoylalanine--D-glutamate ligase n=1 Tax=Thiobacillus denitrificans (strain ATCC 25259 / T1) TaxID=292415 RepID=MURD_THIDA|nr:UDP-N-acetylmuramoyl-L-alanine--D-glutamate ligase [Thiobacillus denitrificans]Q3SMH5.1 RecName: Full=UDP-N-acetylmuramoylalanine--D-glutamate ligase; AltName: Full=D-glutamic acid-adding enzyme; AltName: Full=UDP-N-acetylmuramoyl-L-alanyl-D-glutamate synthetase [Thiobacillus denitrificans ATCC 25259]AAZ96070.1 UDP-N-acetylmuramoylalanine-D-glutamate ligase [Thiobacillus denitrificans ATCC 25259]
MNYDALQLSGRKVLVLGLGDTGLSCARWLSVHGADVSVADSREAPPHAARLAETLPQVALFTGPFEAAHLAAADMLVLSPGVPLSEPAVAQAVAQGVEAVGDVELFARALAVLNAQRAALPAPQAAMRVIAITGSNGKSTVTAMCGDMCRMAGLTVCVAGNIGLPVLDALHEIEQGAAPLPQVWVLELSSFQLETTSSLDATAAAVLNLSEDHMDRYPDMAAYAAAKARIFSGNGVQVLNRDDPRTLAMAIPGRHVVSFGLDRCPTDENFGLCEDELCLGGDMLMPLSVLAVPGLHNAANALAALALTRALDLPIEALLRGLMHFKGLPHRVEKVADIDGVTWYDDSKGTNVGATEAALYGMGRRKAVVILGGDGKGQDFGPLKAAVAANARAVVLIGRDAVAIEAAIEDSGVASYRADTLPDAVEQAARLAEPGDAVLLSPACASFDMFRNYVHRAEVFVDAVKKLAAQRAQV